MRTVNIIKSLVIVSLVSVLAACGGGSDDSFVELPGGETAPDAAVSIISQRPSIDSSAAIDTVVSLSFDEEIASASIAEDAIHLSGPYGTVAGTVSYDPNLNQVNFVPDEYLVAFSVYQVEISGITDMNGNLIEQNQNWSFKTIFDQLPPELPEF